MEIVKNAGKESCNDETVKLIEIFMDGFTKDMLEFACSDYPDGSTKCDTLNSPPKDPSMQRTKSIMFPLISVFSHM